MWKTTRSRARCLLIEAADYMEEHGWTQGAFHRSGSVCLVGSLDEVTGFSRTSFFKKMGWDDSLTDKERALRMKVHRRAMKAVGREIVRSTGRFYSVIGYNDQVLPSGKTGERAAIAVLRGAAKRL